MNYFVLILMSIFCVVINAYAKDSFPIHKNQLLSQAKSSLTRAGWKPYVTNRPEDIGLIQKKYIQYGFNEIENCGASTPYCVFKYKKADKCLNLVAGSYEESVQETTVDKWYFGCK